MNKWFEQYIDVVLRFVAFFTKRFHDKYYRWVFESQLEEIQNKYPGDHWKADLDLMIAIGQTVDPTRWLVNYHPSIGRRIHVVTGFKDAGDLLRWFDLVENSIQLQNNVRDIHLKPSINRMSLTLDDFMVIDKRSAIPTTYYTQLTGRLIHLKTTIDSIPDVNRRKTVYRRLTTVMPDLFSIQEALLSAALEV